MPQTFLLSLLAGLFAACSAAALVNPGLSHSSLPNGPGLTLDESFNIDQGVRLARAFGEYGPLLWLPENAAKVFSKPEHLPDHPPLGRFILGTAHEWFGWLVPGVGQAAYNVAATRLGSALAFGLTVLLLTEFCRQHFNPPTAISTALLLAGTPVLVGHARLAALETCTNLAWTTALVPLLAWWTKAKPPSTTQALLTGGLLGTAAHYQSPGHSAATCRIPLEPAPASPARRPTTLSLALRRADHCLPRLALALAKSTRTHPAVPWPNQLHHQQSQCALLLVPWRPLRRSTCPVALPVDPPALLPARTHSGRLRPLRTSAVPA
ncbi:MAG UNVERIFIED_CONTAM: hypothetical protein LVR18_07460 [Planctomycetaceae bacterium]|jgi:hypothetical protein